MLTNTTDECIDALKCSICDSTFHLNCAGVSRDFFVYYIQQKAKPWSCYSCDCDIRSETKSNAEAIRKIESLANQMNSQVQAISDEVTKFRYQDHSWKKEFEVKVSELIDQKITESLNARPANAFSSHAPPSNISSHNKNLIITGVPQEENENVVTIVKKLARHINFTSSNFLDNCFRVNKKGSGDARSKPPTILLRLTTELARESFLKCYFSHIKKHRLIPNDIDLCGTERIYINEHMNPDLQPVLKRALALRRVGKVSQVASHSSYISVKLVSNDRPKWIRVKDTKSLDTLAGLSQGDSDDEA